MKIERIGDSIIQGKTTMMLETTDYLFYSDQFGDIVFNGPDVWDTNYVYADGDTVFYFQNNEFQKLFDFSKIVGESYLIGETDGNDMCSTSSYTGVTGTGVDGLGYNFIALSSPDTSDLRLSGNYNTRFGGGSFLFPIRHWCDPGIIAHYYDFTFKCFQDDNFFYNPSGEDCEYLLTHLGIVEKENSAVTLMPNPANDIITIEYLGVLEVRALFDVYGKEVERDMFIVEGNTINISSLKKGVYFLYFKDSNNSFGAIKFIKQ